MHALLSWHAPLITKFFCSCQSFFFLGCFFFKYFFPFPGYRKLSEVFDRDLDLKETVANLLEKETTVCGKAYKHVAFHYKMTDLDIDRLERCKNPGEGVLDYLKSTQPDLTSYHFCKVLKGETIRRLDIVYKLLDYLI